MLLDPIIEVNNVEETASTIHPFLHSADIALAR